MRRTKHTFALAVLIPLCALAAPSVVRLPDVRCRFEGDPLNDGRWHPVQTLSRRTQPEVITFTNLNHTVQGITLVSFEKRNRETHHGHVLDDSVMRVSYSNTIYRLNGSFLLRRGHPEQAKPEDTRKDEAQQ